jgi:AGZA family xanthine/uracil permease-like MFS transporter
MGGRIGYSAATGLTVIVLCWLGTISLMLALIPSVAILPILLYIGMLIGSQAFQETPKSHAPAIMLALIPNLASWATNQINGTLSAAGIIVGGLNHDQLEDLVGKMRNEGVLYHGLQVLGGGAILGGLIMGATAVCIIDRNFKKASGFALAGSILTYFGFMHGEKIGIGQTPVVAASYVVVAVILFGCGKFVMVAPKPAESPAAPHGESLPA